MERRAVARVTMLAMRMERNKREDWKEIWRKNWQKEKKAQLAWLSG